MSELLAPLRMGDLWLPNRIVMAPLTRARAVGKDRLANPLMARYYAQRASAGFILSEATVVDPRGVGYANTPGIWSTAQMQSWRGVTRAVHAAGGRIFLQLWHVGRISHPSLLDGALPVAPSPLAPAGHVSLLRPPTPYVVPQALSTAEARAISAQFRHGAALAQDAGFDGVELHAANGYLVDQFLQDHSNHRDDEYGGGPDNRSRLLFECVDALVGVWGADRVGVHLAPRGDAHDMGDSQPLELFSHVMAGLDQRRVAFVCVREHAGPGRLGPLLRKQFSGVYVANEGFDATSAREIVAAGEADAVAFGKAFIANPDLPRRIADGTGLNAPDPSTFYGDGAAGYTDYPALASDA